MTATFATGKIAWGMCDRCGQRNLLRELTDQVVDQKKTGLLVCTACLDTDHPQLRLGKTPIYDPQALRNPRPDKRTDVPIIGQLLQLNSVGVSPLNYATTPDSAAFNITGDMTLIYCASSNAWQAPNNVGVLISKTRIGASSAGFRSFTLQLLAKYFYFYVSADGTSTAVSVLSTVQYPFANGTVGWVKVTLDVNDGAGNKTVRFYTSTQPYYTNPEEVAWTQLGAAVTSAGTTAVFHSTAFLGIGTVETVSGVSNAVTFDAKVYRVQVYNGTTLASDFDPNDVAIGATTITSAATGEVYTLSSAAALQNGFTYMVENFPS